MRDVLSVVSRLKEGVSGQSLYEWLLVDALRKLGMTVTAVTVGGVRSSANIRLPMDAQAALPHHLRRGLGRSVYRRRRRIHRVDLAAPPSPGEVLTIHDLAPLHFPDEGRLPRDAVSSIRAAARVITASHSTAGEIADISGRDDIVVIPHGVDPAVFAATPASDPELARLGIKPPFVLCSGGATARKNLSGLREAWDRVVLDHPDVQLVVCGPARDRKRELFTDASNAIVLGALERSVFLSLLRRASIVVVPSSYEGFGLPVIEGLAVGVPVVAARRSALVEVAGSGAALVEPTPTGLASGMHEALKARHVPASASTHRSPYEPLDWSIVAERHRELYSTLGW